MLKIRLTRTGRKNQPSYRIVVSEARSKRDGRYVDCLGFYNPTKNPSLIKIDKKKYQQWLAKGAQPTKIVKSFLTK